MKQKRISLTTQINLIFTLITFVTSALFFVAFRQTINNFTMNQANRHFLVYKESLERMVRYSLNDVKENEYYAFSYFNPIDTTVLKKENKNYLNDSLVNNMYNSYKELEEKENDKVYDYLEYQYTISNINGNVLLIVSDGSYAITLKEPINNIIIFGFIAIIILGNAIILLWTNVTVERIKKLEKDVTFLNETNYQKEINVEGIDEIADLAQAIDKMRKELLKNENIKQEMLQNISHDIKTPIAVIRSYAEAIKDGVTDIKDLETIIIQSEILNKKVKQLLDWNKLEYIKDQKDFVLVNIKEIIQTVVSNYKYKTKANFILSLDDSKYLGIVDNYYGVINNIIENATRYAINTIKITLENEKLTIYNDGEHMGKDFINNKFKPYEKGYKGQFGLGMTIVQRTLEKFKLKLTVKNHDIGVSFTIEPL